MKLRASWLDKWRRFLRVPEFTEEMLLRSMAGAVSNSEHAAIGTAFHRVMERMVEGEIDRCWGDLAVREEEGYEFWLPRDAAEIEVPALPAQAEVGGAWNL